MWYSSGEEEGEVRLMYVCNISEREGTRERERDGESESMCERGMMPVALLRAPLRRHTGGEESHIHTLIISRSIPLSLSLSISPHIEIKLERKRKMVAKG